MTASFLTYPLDLIRTYLAINVQNDPTQNGIWNTGLKVFKAEGYRGLFKGLNASLFGIIPYIGFKMGSFDILQSHFLPNKNHPWFNTANLVLGATAGTIAVTFTYPTDVIRRRIQIMGSPEQPDVYKNMWDAFATVYRKEGMNGLFKGLIPCYLKVIPATALLFMSNEILKKHLGI